MSTTDAIKATGGVIYLTNRFDRALHREFRDAVIEAIKHPAAVVTVDLGSVSYIDSSALGMLLMLREMAEKAGKQVSLANCRGNVLRVINFAQFDKFFKIL